MTLTKFLKALKTKEVLVTVLDKEDNEICKIYADGSDALADDIEAREVDKWVINSSSSITVTIKDAV